LQDSFTLRPVEPGDGPAIGQLSAQTPDTGIVSFASQYHYDPYAILMALHPHTIGVVAQVQHQQGIVGLGLVSFGECRFEQQQRRFGYLNTLNVHPDFRRQGIAKALANWRFEKAQAEVGEDGVIYASIQTGNTGSRRTAARWATQTLESCTKVCAIPMRTKAPTPLSGVEVRPAQAAELEQIAAKQNAFYAGHNFYSPRTAADLASWRARAVQGQALGDYYVTVDQRGNVLASMGIVQLGKFVSNRVVKMPFALRVANRLLKAVPADDVMRRIQVEQFWYAPDQVAAGRYLWESVRWHWRDRGTTLVAFYDPRSPVAEAIVLPRLAPTTGGALVLKSAVQARTERPVYWGG
jgi:GNAT superfamily N-acetyltransferase